MSTVIYVTERDFDWDPTEFRYVQVADDIARQIADGTLPEGAALAAIGRLAEQYGVARMTIVRATEVLKERGLVVVRHGRGTFVKRQPSGDVPERPETSGED